MSVPTTIDSAAPVIARHEIDVRASLDTVWALHVNVDAWPTWQSDITAAHADGPFAVGNSFTWTSYGFTVTSTIYEIVDRARVLWGGTGDGITGIHVPDTVSAARDRMRTDVRPAPTFVCGAIDPGGALFRPLAGSRATRPRTRVAEGLRLACLR